MINYAECKVCEGIVPDDVKPFFLEYEQYGAAANDTLESITVIANEDGVKTMKFIAKLPWPLSNRVMFSSHYLELDQEDGSHMMLFSGDGNGGYANDENVMTAKEKKKLVVAHTYVSGWWAVPIKDDSGAVTGCRMLYFASIEAGGNIPTFVQNS